MTGFEVSFEGKTISASIDKGLLMVIIDHNKNKSHLHISGSNKSERIKWYSENIDVDNIIVRVVDVKQNSEIKEYLSGDEIDTKDLLADLSVYKRLKQELNEEGLI
jgi:intein-encoded DNA endonuclease-like protein